MRQASTSGKMCEGQGGRSVLYYLDSKPPFAVFGINECPVENTAVLPLGAVIDSLVDES